MLNHCPCGKPKSKKAVLCRSCDVARRHSLRGTNGMSEHPMYDRWQLMLRRCYNQNDKRFFDYGGRGIKVCDSWHQFVNYLEDMGEVPFEGAEVDRIDPDGNYEPSNCRFVDRKENTSNRRNCARYKSKYRMVRIDKLCTVCQENIFHKIKKEDCNDKK